MSEEENQKVIIRVHVNKSPVQLAHVSGGNSSFDKWTCKGVTAQIELWVFCL